MAHVYYQVCSECLSVQFFHLTSGLHLDPSPLHTVTLIQISLAYPNTKMC